MYTAAEDLHGLGSPRPAVSLQTSFTALAIAWVCLRSASPREASQHTRYRSDFAAMISAAMSASMNSIAWNPTIGLRTGAGPGRTRARARAHGRSRAHRAGADHDAFLDEPVLRELEALADLAEHAVVAHAHALERVDRMLEERTCACTWGCERLARLACPCRRGRRSPSPGRRRRGHARGRSPPRRRSSRATSRRRAPRRRRLGGRWSRPP